MLSKKGKRQPPTDIPNVIEKLLDEEGKKSSEENEVICILNEVVDPELDDKGPEVKKSKFLGIFSSEKESFFRCPKLNIRICKQKLSDIRIGKKSIRRSQMAVVGQCAQLLMPELSGLAPCANWLSTWPMMDCSIEFCISKKEIVLMPVRI